MSWVLLAFLSSVSAAVKNAITKFSLKNFDEYVVGFCLFLFMIPFILPFVNIGDIPLDSQKFLILLLVSVALDIPAFIFMLKAFKREDLSLIVPLVSLIPIVILLIELVIFQQAPSSQGILGIFVVFIGVYLLQYDWRKKGILAPFKSLVSEKGSRYMLISVTLWGIIANIHKNGIQDSSPLVWGLSTSTLSALVMLVILFFRRPKIKKETYSMFPILILVGLLQALEVITQNFSFNLTFASYVISLKQSQILFTILFGFLFFKERKVRQRFIGASVMIAGVLLIIFS